MVDFKKKIYILDGAMGTEIQKQKVDPSLFSYEEKNCEGFNDILCLTCPDVIQSIHEDYLKAGADIIETNTFNANYVSAEDYSLSNEAIDLINYRAAQIAKKAANKHGALVAGVLGPTSKTLSMSPDVEDPAYRNITYERLFESYRSATENLIKGGADLIMIETVFDTLNAKSAIEAVRSVSDKIPLMISGTIVDASGRTLSGQTVEAFWQSVKHANPISVGLNCALGTKQMTPYIARLAEVCSCAISAHPNAGLPNDLGEYDQSPSEMANIIEEFCDNGFINIVGGCCGTTVDHCKAISNKIIEKKPRVVPEKDHKQTKLSGLEPLNIDSDSLFVNVGERTNVTGSRKFARLITEKKYEEALEVAREQVELGAQIIDVNMDEGMLDAKLEMEKFLKMLATEPGISKVPVMIDSSKWDVIEEGLKILQGKCIVNSISLKEGEEDFLHKASLCKKYGAAVIVMLFDEDGQADTLEKKNAIA